MDHGKIRTLVSAVPTVDGKQCGPLATPPSWWNLLILVTPLIVLFLSVRNSRFDSEIARRQRTAVATINSHDPPHHDRYGYVFLVNRTQYTGWAFPNDKVDYSLGEQISIHYDPTDPATRRPTFLGHLKRERCAI
jgi:hypothetical protein